MEDNRFVTRQFAASMLGVSLRSLDRYATEGRLTKYQKLGKVFYLREEVTALARPRVVR